MFPEIFKKYWLAIAAFCVYGWLWYHMLTIKAQFEAALSRLSQGETVSRGEVVMNNELLVLALGMGGTTVFVLIALFNKEKRGFYLTLSILTILPVALFLCMSNFLG